MSEARCPVTELLTDQCAHCRPAAAEPRSEDPFNDPAGAGPAFEAAWPGRCDACDAPFEAGEVIRRLLGRRGGYVCEECWE